MPWVNYRSEETSGAFWDEGSYYFEELQRHIPLHGIRVWNYFNPDGGDGDMVVADRLMDDTLREINLKIGLNKVIPITTSQSVWNTNYMYSGGKIENLNKSLWRVTVEEGVDSITINGTPYDFGPETKGVWYEAPLNTTSLTIVDTT
jgi:hypothetical protein